ncbi:hypothetical protein L208DRAFT_1409988 [Tricholoma matsutake]|nr:hypothetical protein L208DRAFT_1409988 [Tricholoma matsutake 945]
MPLHSQESSLRMMKGSHPRGSSAQSRRPRHNHTHLTSKTCLPALLPNSDTPSPSSHHLRGCPHRSSHFVKIQVRKA